MISFASISRMLRKAGKTILLMQGILLGKRLYPTETPAFSPEHNDPLNIVIRSAVFTTPSVQRNG